MRIWDVEKHVVYKVSFKVPFPERAVGLAHNAMKLWGLGGCRQNLRVHMPVATTALQAVCFKP